MLLAVSLGLLAAFLNAAAASLQQHGTQLAHQSLPPHRGGSPLAIVPTLARRLVHTRIWLAGWVTDLSGFVAQAGALTAGSVALVQPLLVTELLFALPLATAWSRRMPGRRAWVSAAAISGGVAIFLAVPDAAPVDGAANRERIIVAGVLAIIVVGVLLLVALGRRPLVQATLVAVAAGLCFAMSAVLLKLTSEDLLERGIAATATDWVGYGLAAATLSGLLLVQWAFTTGSLAAAVATMTITNPIASYLVGVWAFHAEPPTTAGALAGVAGAGALISAGVVGLSHSSIVRPTQDAPAGATRDHD
ncbi:hypothetical protein GCM10022251_24450 [Phytohabitans flavus]|uniref:Integral membrane protein n=1 Tax=Phytohabitans flavus TaxID=1076124 RepID=A0A6F8XR92_9ACTN|nr:DMT family transporter [Phytohabitans flavus]BCB76355.1 hypothetical protein Pflav_027650 [Phytohabitans flavus]